MALVTSMSFKGHPGTQEGGSQHPEEGLDSINSGRRKERERSGGQRLRAGPMEAAADFAGPSLI